MRVSLLIAAVLVLFACGKNDQASTSQNLDQGLTADSIVSNDVTAIDAVTGDAANMAADVDMNFGNLDAPEDSTSNAASNAAASSKPAVHRPAPAKAKPASESNTAAADTASNAE